MVRNVFVTRFGLRVSYSLCSPKRMKFAWCPCLGKSALTHRDTAESAPRGTIEWLKKIHRRPLFWGRNLWKSNPPSPLPPPPPPPLSPSSLKNFGLPEVFKYVIPFLSALCTGLNIDYINECVSENGAASYPVHVRMHMSLYISSQHA